MIVLLQWSWHLSLEGLCEQLDRVLADRPLVLKPFGPLYELARPDRLVLDWETEAEADHHMIDRPQIPAQQQMGSVLNIT